MQEKVVPSHIHKNRHILHDQVSRTCCNPTNSDESTLPYRQLSEPHAFNCGELQSKASDFIRYGIQHKYILLNFCVLHPYHNYIGIYLFYDDQNHSLNQIENQLHFDLFHIEHIHGNFIVSLATAY